MILYDDLYAMHFQSRSVFWTKTGSVKAMALPKRPLLFVRLACDAVNPSAFILGERIVFRLEPESNWIIIHVHNALIANRVWYL